MATRRHAQASFQGLSGELRNRIYALVAADTPDKHIILGRKLVEASRRKTYGGDIIKQTFSALVQHPLSLTCRQIRAKYRSTLRRVPLTREKLTYDFVINNFDPEQLRAFKKLRSERKLVYGKSCCLGLFHLRLRMQLDHNVVSSALALRKDLYPSGWDKRYHLPDRLDELLGRDFLMLRIYRDLFSWKKDGAKGLTIEQARGVSEIFGYPEKCECHADPTLSALIVRLNGLLGGRVYEEWERSGTCRLPCEHDEPPLEGKSDASA